MQNKTIQEKFEDLSYYFFLAFIFFLPFDNQRNNFLLGGFLLFSVLNKNFYQSFRKIYFENKALWIPVLLFILLALSTLFSENLERGTKVLFHQLGLFIFPVFVPFLLQKFNDKFKTILLMFIAGVLFSAMYLIIFAFYRSVQFVDGSWQIIHFTYPLANMSHFYAITRGYSYFTYSGLSVFMHPGYFALYIILALIGVYFLKKKLLLAKHKQILLYSAASFLLFIFVLLLSRAAILALAVVFVVGVIFQVANNKNRSRNVLALSVGLVIFGFIFVFNGRFMSDMPEESQLEQNAESKNDRLIIWETSLELIGKNWLLGYGTGDYRDNVLNAYEKGGYIAFKERKANSHNQFFETTLQSGISGLFLLLLMFFMFFYKGIKQQQVEILQIGAAIFIAFIFESMLLRISGVYIFSLSYVMLMIKLKNSNKNILQI